MTANAIVWTYLENKPQTTMGRILCMFVIYFVLIVDHCKLVSGITSLMVGKRQIVSNLSLYLLYFFRSKDVVSMCSAQDV